MPRNESGVYSLPAGVIVTTGENILPSQHNPALQDFASDANVARPVNAGGTGAATAAAARTSLGVVIGSQVQAYNANLASLAGLTLAADKVVYSTGAATLAVADMTAAGRALLDDANAAAQLVTLGVTATAAELNLTDGAASHDSAAWIAGTATEPGLPSPANVVASIAAQNPIKAWVNFDGSTSPPTIQGSDNVSGMVKNDTGDYTITFSAAMPDTNYAAILSGNGAIGSGNSASQLFEFTNALTTLTRTTTTFRLQVLNVNGSAAVDGISISAVFFR